MPPIRKTVAQARGLRRTLTPPEIALWQWLRGRPEGLKFRRQHPVGSYVLDFFCASVRLAIEIDGSHHDGMEQITHDQRRDAWLRSQGIRVLRIKAGDVLSEIDSVTRYILGQCHPFPLHHPSDGPPPPATRGEDLR
ncbi:endonuclease domain-containing protein [Sphingobium sp.]|uniref:endonuclease domain-containing protein n=1 Tax=Sphingobium sp. TaxID=1912891 RepID=UPI0028BED81F|nr:endonuclease domain-containing protein [Sphingobium sp.]